MISWLRRLSGWRGAIESVSPITDAPAQDPTEQLEPLLAKAHEHVLQADLVAAWSCISRALELAPQSAQAHGLAARVKSGLNDAESALDHYALALHFNPDDWDAADGRSQLLERGGETGRAVAGVKAFFAAHPGHPGASYRLARLHYGAGRHEAALSQLQDALAQNPENIAALNLYGLIQAREFGRLREGELALLCALRLRPDFLDARSNLGWVYAEQGRAAEAIECFDAVLSCDAQDQETRLMRSYTYLKNGEFSRGWQDFEARHASPFVVRRLLLSPSCNSAGALSGKRVLINAEQGLGDQIMFASCFQDLRSLAASCTIECDPRLVKLFQRSFPWATVVGRAPEDTRRAGVTDTIDCQIPTGSLPGLFRNAWSEFPVHQGYLSADPAKVEAWRARLAELGPGPYIGISWRGGAQATRRQLRSIPLMRWKELLAKPANFTSLQYGDLEQDLLEVGLQTGVQICHWPEAIDDYDETAALVAALDVVVSVCTAVVHLAGALGRSAMVLTPATPEWRYLASGSRMPWYPSVQLFRQGPGEAWEAVLARVSAALAEALRI